MENLKLFLVKQDKYSWDEQNGFVICAENEIEAEKLILKELSIYDLISGFKNTPDFIEIGIANKGTKEGIILKTNI